MTSQIAFILCAGVAILLALLFALWPTIPSLFRPRQPRPRLPHGLSLTLLALIPAVTILAYLQVGTYGAAEVDDPRITLLRSQMVDLARDLEKDPGQPEQWQRMGLIYKDLRQHGPAEHALRRALYLRSESAFLHVELAETLHLRSERTAMPVEARRLLERAVDLEPDNLKALWLLATDDFLDGDYETALAWWEQMLPLVPADSPMHRALLTETQRARDLLNEKL